MNKNPGFIYMDSPITIQFRLSGYQDGDAAYEKERFTGETLHISERGMVLLVKHPVPEESFVTLTFCGERSGTCEKLIGKIKKVEACREESFLVGVELVSRVRERKLSSPRHPNTHHSEEKFPAGAKGNHNQRYSSR